MKKLVRLFTIVIALVLSVSMMVCAQGNAFLIEVHDNEEAPELFVKGTGGVDSATAIVGNSEGEVTVDCLSDGDIYIDTLILIDNSLSVPQESLDQIKNIIIQLVGARKDGQERFSVTTYSDTLGDIPAFSFDYQTIQASINAIEREDQDTRLTDAITNIIKSGILDDTDECAYRRMIICSDGVDDQGGYSASERDELLKDSNVPIYTIGVYDNKGTNDSDLADFFALSRETHAAYFLLSDKPADKVSVLVGGDNCAQVKDSSEWNIIGDALNVDREIVRFSVSLPDDVKDGSVKSVTVKFSSSDGEQSVTADNIRMPHVVIEKEEPAPDPAPEPEPEIVEEEQKEAEPEEEESFLHAHGLLLIIGLLVLAAIVLTVVMILILRKSAKKKREKYGITESDPIAIGDPFTHTVTDDGGATMILGGTPAPAGDGNTVMIFNPCRSYTVTLIDVASPARMFSKPIDEVIVIGTSAMGVDIVIDYDKAISHRHCQIKRLGDRFYLEDLHSTNGTYINDSRVLSEVELFSGSVITLGTHKFRVEMS